MDSFSDVAHYFHPHLGNKKLVVINCTGLGAIHLAKDSSLYPIRGQIIILRTPPSTPPFRCAFFDRSAGVTYVIPNQDGHLVECGGTTLAGVWSREPNAQTTEQILTRCRAMLPCLSQAQVVDLFVGLRPGRKGGIRLELEWVPISQTNDRGSLPVIHSYGYGGAGYSLSWGAAQEVLKLVRKVISSSSISIPSKL